MDYIDPIVGCKSLYDECQRSFTSGTDAIVQMLNDERERETKRMRDLLGMLPNPMEQLMREQQELNRKLMAEIYRPITPVSF